MTEEELETLAVVLRRESHTEHAIQEALLSVWLHAPIDPLRYARNLIRRFRMGEKRNWARARKHTSEILPVLEGTSGPFQLAALEAEEQLEAVSRVLPSLWAQGWEPTRLQRFRLRAEKAPVRLILEETVEELWDTLTL